MSNIMDLVKLRNKVSRSGFDLSRKNIFTAKAGELLPVCCIETLPGDKFDIDMAWFTRTQPVNTAAYTRMREYYDFYFVPTNLLWDKFNTFVTQMKDNNTKAQSINSSQVLSDEHPYMTHLQVYDYIHNMDTLNKQGKNLNFLGYRRSDLSCKLLHYLDYGDFYPSLEESWQYTIAKLNPFPLLAYQKIYQDHFRNSQWEKADASSCNINYMSGVAGSNALPISEISYDKENMFDLHYANWNKDYFMGLLPSSQYGSPASVINIGDAMNMQVSRVDGTAIPDNTPITTNRSAVYADSLKSYVSALKAGSTSGNHDLRLTSQTNFTILALRQAEALQKWSEITQSVQQDYKSQISAHFGVDVSEALSERSKYLGGVSGNVDISAVVNQNITETNDPKIAGQGTGGSRGKIEFESSVHGYIMCIYHCVPLLDYSLDGIKRQNLKTNVYDYAIPEFDQTGMVSVPLVELTSRWSNETPDVNKALLGYAPRYIDYKISYDNIHGAIYNGGLMSWAAPVDRNYVLNYLKAINQTALTGVLTYPFFKVPPSVLNPIFGFDADSFVQSDQFLVNASFDIKAVRNLDRNGLPI